MKFFRKETIFKVPYFYFFASILVILFCASGFETSAQSRLYLSNDDHTDYMWTADETTYDTLFTNMIDAWIANNNATNANPADYQTKFNLDGTYWAWAYQKRKTPAQFQTFVNQLKSERLVMPMNPLIITYGCVPAEAALRGMYYAGELQRKYGVPFEMAMSMENQTVPLGIASLWKGAGAKYSWHGICNCYSLVPNITSQRQSELYRYKGLDDSSVLMKWYSMSDPLKNDQVGGYAEARDGNTAVTQLKAKLNTTDYNYNVAAAFGVGWDDDETLTDQLAPIASSSSDVSTRVIVSNELDFFRDIEKTYGASIPSLTQSYGNEWEAASASLAEISAKVKRSLEKLRAAEAMATIVARTNSGFASSLDSMRRQAWMSLGLYWEHDFEGNGPAVPNTERAAWQVRQQQAFSDYVDQLYNLSKANLTTQIKKAASSNSRFFVFNPLSWQRTDYADFPYNGSLPINVWDLGTNTEVRSQIIIKNDTQYVRILASNIPSLGYKTFEIRSGSGTAFSSAATINSTTRTIDNDYYTLIFNQSGTITSLIDKANGNKQLVNSQSNTDYINNLSRNQSYVGTDNSGSFTVDNNGAVSLSVIITSSYLVNHSSTITVFKGIPRIEIDNQITENFGEDSVYNTFSFNTTSISSPTIWHEEDGAILHAKKVSNGGHYADNQARYDLLTLNHFAAVSSNGSYGVTLSNQDCYFMQTGNSTVSTLDENTGKIKVVVAGRFNNLGMYSQNGDNTFNQRYAISSYPIYSATKSMKNSLEHQDAFVTGTVSNTSGILDPTSFSFLNISDTNTLVWALKPVEEGMDSRGALVRVWNEAATNSNNDAFTFNDIITEAENVTHIETDISSASYSNNVLTASIGKNQIKSFRVKLTPAGALIISIRNFTGIKQNGINKLNWTADSGIDFSHFELERSEDGNSFSIIDSINYDINEKDYSYNDANINELKSYYYRLKLIQKDGTFTYSNIVIIMTDSHTKDILLYPNPVVDILNFQLVLSAAGRYDVWVDDITGKTVSRYPSPLFEAGNNYFSMNLSFLPKGTYTLIVRNADNKYVRKFVKH